MLKPKKSLSQNFLIDKNIANKIISNITIANKNIIEIGPGYGMLTDLIIQNKPKNLIIIEKDNVIYEKLKKKYLNLNYVQIYNGDALNFNYENYKNYKIISNLPYNISTRLILKFYEKSNFINEILVMLQKEVALKFNYELIKNNKYKFLTYIYTKFKICFFISPNVFYPKPRVDSCVVKFIIKKNNYDWIKLNNFINVIFNQKRKIILRKLNIRNKSLDQIMNKRVEDLTNNEILKIYNFF